MQSVKLLATCVLALSFIFTVRENLLVETRIEHLLQPWFHEIR